VDDIDVLAKACTAFGLGTPTGDACDVARGAMGQGVRVDTDRGSWAVKRLFPWASIANAEIDMTVQEAAARAGVPLPRPIRSVNGNAVEAVDGENYRVYEWIEIASLPSSPASLELAGAIGRTLATLHAMRLPAAQRVTPWLTTRPPQERWRALAEQSTAASAPWASALAGALPILRALEPIADRSPVGDPILCHNDLGPGNVAHGSAGELIVLDWEHAGPQAPSQELGYVLVAWCTEGGSADAAVARTLASGYRQVTPFPETPDIAMFAGVACSTLNFIAGQIHSALTSTDEHQRDFATANLSNLLERPLTTEMLQTLADAVATA
jgi:Ser/Thr protein kinase RdoA (MazF antagonist)